jgi:hypothetical protein
MRCRIGALRFTLCKGILGAKFDLFMRSVARFHLVALTQVLVAVQVQ